MVNFLALPAKGTCRYTLAVVRSGAVRSLSKKFALVYRAP